MELKDYVNKLEAEKKKQLPAWVKIYPNIEFFNLSKEKLKLIKSFQDYIPDYDFNKYASQSNNSKCQGYIMQQVKTANNLTAGALIEIKKFCIKSNGYDDYQCYDPLENQEYQARTNKFKLEGSQHFYKLCILPQGGGFSSAFKEINDLNFTGNLTDAHIFYSQDGKVFITKALIDRINQNSEAALGNFLAQEAVELKQKVYKK